MSAPVPRFAALLILSVAVSALLGQDTPAPQPASAEELQRWIVQLGDSHFTVRQKASERLLAAGPAALPYLEEATRSDDLEVVQRSWWVIDKLAGDGHIPALLFKLSDESAPVRAAAADQLGKMGSKAKEAVTALTKVTTKDSSEAVRLCALEALKVIQASAELQLEVADLDCPAPVGREVHYRIEIANQGTASATTVRVMIQVPEEIEVTRVDGPNFRQDGQRIASIAQTLEPGCKFRWDISGKAVKAGEVTIAVELLADQLSEPMRDLKKSLIVEAAKEGNRE